MIKFYALFIAVLLGACQAISRSHGKMEDMSVVYVPIPDTVYVDNDTLAIENQFNLYHYRPEDYVVFIGLDDIALFSSAVSINEDLIAVGSNGYNIFEGIVHIYTHQSACHWTLQSYIHSPVGDNGGFGNAVALERNRVIIGANAWESYTGKAFIYSFYENVYWKLEATLESPLGATQGFGYEVSLSNNYALVTTGVNNVYVYENKEYGWTLTADLHPPLPYIKFGHSAAICGDYIVVGAEAWQNSTGKVFIYHVDNSTWSLNYTLDSVTGQNSYFGHSVDIYNDTIVVGAKGFQILQYHSQGIQTKNNSGWAYIYERHPNNSWLLHQSIQSPVGENSFFGAEVSVHKNSIIVGADGFPDGDITGSAFAYRRDEPDGEFIMENAYASVAGYKGHFGWAVDICDTFSAIGAYGYDDLRGGMFLACRQGVPSPPPTSQPSAQPTSAPTREGGAINARDDGIVINKTKWPWGIVVAILIGVCIMACIIGLCIYCCCLFCCFPVVIADKKKKKKKKKEEEGESTYTIHGPGGLIDEDGTVYGPEFLTTASTVITESYDDDDEDVYEETTETIVKKKGGKKGKKGGKESSYKVYGYQGPLEGESSTTDEARSQRESEKNSGVSSSSSVVSSATTTNSVVSKEDSDVVAAFKLSRQNQDKVFTKPKHGNGVEMNVMMERAEEVADIYESKTIKDSFFENSGMSTDAYDYQPQQRSIQVASTKTTTTVSTHQSNTMFISPVNSTSDSGSVHTLNSKGSDSSSVKDAKARLNAYKAKLHEVNAANNATNQAYANHKARMEAEEKQREEENARIRAHMEQTRLMAEAAEAAKAAEMARAAEVETYRTQIENARKAALEQEAAQKKANLNLMKAKAEEEAKAKFAQFKAQRDAEAAKKAEEEARVRMELEASRKRAEDEQAAQSALEANAAVQQAKIDDEAQRAADKARLKEEARLRAEEKAKARFLSFKEKAKAQSEGSGEGASRPVDNAANMEAIAQARAKLDAINAVLREKPAETAPPAPEVFVNNTNIVNETHNETITNNIMVTNTALRNQTISLEYTDDMV